jgi:cytochrome c oxidase subunit 3
MSKSESNIHGAHSEHVIDRESGKLGMWLFLFTELLLFGGLFLVYAVQRHKFAADFHLAAADLDAFVGAFNTVVLLVSSMTIAMSITAIQKGNNKLAGKLVLATVLMAVIFMINKYFEWGAKIDLNLFPGTEVMKGLDLGQIQFFGLYFFMTGLHALHVLIGIAMLLMIYFRIKSGRINKDSFLFLENGGLYWHLVDLVWIFLFPLLYLLT